MACAVTIVVMVAGFVTTAAPAQAAFTSAYANLMIVGNGQDGTRTYSLAAGDVFTSPGAIHGASITWQRPSELGSWTLDFSAAMAGAPLQGTYEGSLGGYKADSLHPRLQLTASPVCEWGTGRFVVNQIELTPEKAISKLDLYFEYKCSATVYGRIVIDLPAPQTSAAGNPAVLLGASDATDPALVRVFADAPAGVAAITARVFSRQTGLQVGSTNKFVRQFGTDSRGAWISTQRLTLGPPGFYRIDTDIVDRNNTQVTQSAVGYLAYAIHTSISNPVASPNFVNATRRTTSVSGVLTSRQPGSDVTAPVAGAVVTAIRQSLGQAIGSEVTAADGSFSILVTVDRTDQIYLIYDGDRDNLVVGTESSSVEIRLDKSPARINGPTAVWATNTAVTGTATYHSTGSGYLPLANTQVELQTCNVSGSCDRHAFAWTDAQGRYSVTYTGSVASGGSLKVVALPTDPFIARPEWPISLAVYVEGVTIPWFVPAFLSESVVQLIGEVTIPGTPATKLPIAIQRRPNSGSGWVTVAVAEAVQHDDGWWYFETVLTIPCGRSMWRATYGPSDNVVSKNDLQGHQGCLVPVRPDTNGDGPGTLPPQR